MSLYLPEQKLGTHSEPGSNSHKFLLKGRQTGSMHRGHSWVFRAETHDTMLAWFGVIKELTEKSGEARNEYVRRTHARTVSAGSMKAPSIRSTGSGMEDDEADVAPFSGEQSIRGQSVAPEGTSGVDPGAAEYEDIDDNRSEPGWRPQRPTPGGRFPSDLNVQRGLQAPLSPSSGDSIDETDREAIAQAGALPRNRVPFVAGTTYQPHTGLQHPQDEYQEPYNQPRVEQQAFHQSPGALQQAYQPPRAEQQYGQPLGTFQQTRQQPYGEQQAYSQPLGDVRQTHHEPQREFQQTYQPRVDQEAYQPRVEQQAYQQPREELPPVRQQPQAPYYAAQQSGNERAGAAGSADNDTAGISSYTAGDHRRVAPTSEGAVPIETASTYGEWMAPLAAGVGGAGLGAAGAHEYQRQHDQKQPQSVFERPQQQHYQAVPESELEPQSQSRRQSEPESVSKLEPESEPQQQPELEPERVDDQPNAIPAAGESSAPIMTSTAAPADAPTRPRAMTDSTQDTSVNTMADSGYTVSTVPTSFGAGSEASGSNGQAVIVETPPSDRPWGKSDPPLDTYKPLDNVTFSGHDAATVPHRPELPQSAKSTNTISDLHIPGEFPKAPRTASNEYRQYYE